MMGFIADGQADPDMVEERDQRFRISSEAKREERVSIPAPRVAPGADAWNDGEASRSCSMRPSRLKDARLTTIGRVHCGT